MRAAQPGVELGHSALMVSLATVRLAGSVCPILARIGHGWQGSELGFKCKGFKCKCKERVYTGAHRDTDLFLKFLVGFVGPPIFLPG